MGTPPGRSPLPSPLRCSWWSALCIGSSAGRGRGSGKPRTSRTALLAAGRAGVFRITPVRQEAGGGGARRWSPVCQKQHHQQQQVFTCTVRFCAAPRPAHLSTPRGRRPPRRRWPPCWRTACLSTPFCSSTTAAASGERVTFCVCLGLPLWCQRHMSLVQAWGTLPRTCSTELGLQGTPAGAACSLLV